MDEMPSANAADRPTPGRQGQRRDSTQKAIRDAAISMFSEFGYHAVTLRKLADRIGIQAGSLYNHIENKQELLFEILYEIMSDLVRSFEEKVAPVNGPQARLDAFIQNHVAFHTARKEEVFIGNMELRNLSPENRAKMVALRDRYENYVIEILREGQATGVFARSDPKMASFAIFGMLNSVANWFNPGGQRSADDIAKQYTQFIHAMLEPKARRS
ncbi:TetR/AcrR family transcriptional regulator [Mesorhizobium sp. KR9-304]|uniref:TetR/AcrR family transcriptional regulator n=1 Tax=Mesorhizobium sp. KR9-304 TaxID=3156614 RepID=UPI0032B3ADDD